MKSATSVCRWRGWVWLLILLPMFGVSPNVNAQLSGQFLSPAGTMAAYEYQRDGIETVMLPADVAMTFSGNGSTLSATIRKPIIGDTQGAFDYPIAGQFPMNVTGTSSDGKTFHGNLLGTQYLFDWDIEPSAAGQLSWSGRVYWAGGRYELTNIAGAHLIAASPGDYNVDGVVDAADYVSWRKNDGTPAGYETWREHFGETAGSGTSAVLGAGTQAAVPEASTLMLLAFAIGAMFLPRGGNSLRR